MYINDATSRRPEGQAFPQDGEDEIIHKLKKRGKKNMAYAVMVNLDYELSLRVALALLHVRRY
jgi:hypothetical protein